MRLHDLRLPALVFALLMAAPDIARAAPEAAPPAVEDARPREIPPPRTPPPPDPRAQPRAAAPDALRPSPPPRADPPPPTRPAAPTPSATVVKKSATPKKTKGPKNGWYPRLSVGVATSLAHNQSVPGVADGIHFTFGAVIDGVVKLVHGQSRWITTLKILNTHSKTPVVTPVLKTADELDLKTLYVHRLKGKMDKAMIFAGLQLTAPLFPGDLVAAKDTDLTRTDVTGNSTSDLARRNRRYRLTPAFSPVFFRQLLGMGAHALKSRSATLQLTLGITSQQIWASGWAANDDKTTPELELTALRDYQQLGVATGFVLTGSLHKRMSYGLHAEFFYPLVTSFEPTPKGFDLMDIDLGLRLSLKVARWVSLDYVLSARRLPLIVDQFQLLNSLVLSITAQIM
ncbi:MAG: hypothetical protein ABI333_19820 [bacterium]